MGNSRSSSFDSDALFSYTSTIIAKVVDQKDQAMKDAVIKYAREQSTLTEKVEVLFLDKDIADEIIELGIREYIRRHPKSILSSDQST